MLRAAGKCRAGEEVALGRMHRLRPLSCLMNLCTEELGRALAFKASPVSMLLGVATGRGQGRSSRDFGIIPTKGQYAGNWLGSLGCLDPKQGYL